MANVFWKLLILLQLLQEDAEYSKNNILVTNIKKYLKNDQHLKTGAN